MQLNCLSDAFPRFFETVAVSDAARKRGTVGEVPNIQLALYDNFKTVKLHGRFSRDFRSDNNMDWRILLSLRILVTIYDLRVRFLGFHAGFE